MVRLYACKQDNTPRQNTETFIRSDDLGYAHHLTKSASEIDEGVPDDKAPGLGADCYFLLSPEVTVCLWETTKNLFANLPVIGKPGVLHAVAQPAIKLGQISPIYPGETGANEVHLS